MSSSPSDDPDDSLLLFLPANCANDPFGSLRVAFSLCSLLIHALTHSLNLLDSASMSPCRFMRETTRVLSLAASFVFF